LTKPTSKEDIENIRKWLEFFGSTLIDEQEEKEIKPS
jgi:hypothetical protein